MEKVYNTVLEVEEEKFKRRDGSEGVAVHFHVVDAHVMHNVTDKNGNELRFRNFAGIAGPMNHEGDRNFIWVWDNPEIADILRGEGFNVKEYEYDDGSVAFQLKIRVKYRGTWSDPKIYLDSDTAPRVEMPEECLGDLDDMFFEHVDFTFTKYNYKAMGRTGVSAYLEDALIYKRAARTRASRYETVHYGNFVDVEE